MRLVALQNRRSLARLALFLALAFFALVRQSEAAGFIAGIEDLPLMDGLLEDRGAGLIFDKPDGRLVEAYAFGHSSEAEIARFYQSTLPELGWHSAAPLIFEREGERLKIMLEPESEGISVHFLLTPQ